MHVDKLPEVAVPAVLQIEHHNYDWENVDESRFLRRGRESREKGKNDKGKEKGADENKGKGKDKDSDKNKKDQKGKSARGSPSPSQSPSYANFVSSAALPLCSLFCDGVQSNCYSPEECCDSTQGLMPCDASYFDQHVYHEQRTLKRGSEKTTYHCARSTSYMGQCVQHDIAMKYIDAMPCSSFCDGLATSCDSPVGCCPEGFSSEYVVCEDYMYSPLSDTLLRKGKGKGKQDQKGEIRHFRCGKISSVSNSGECNRPSEFPSSPPI